MIGWNWRIVTLIIGVGLALGWGSIVMSQDEKPKEEAKTETKTEEAKPEETKPEEKKPEENQPAAPTTPKVSVEVNHLDNPSGVAIHPGSKQVFVTSNQGVFRFVPGKPRKIYLEVEGFPTDVYGKGPMYNIGPLGCALWGTDRLIVPDGSRKDGEELVRIYKVEDAVPEKPRKEDGAEFTLGPIAPGDLSPKGEGNFYAAVVWNDAIYVTSNGDDNKGWIAKSVIADGKPGPLTPTIATKEATGVDAPIAITVSPDKANLVVSQGGEVNQAGDSLLTMYDGEGKLVKKLATGLNDITGLAYSPTGKLYATDFSWVDPTQGGLFELTIEGDKATAKKIIELDRPTSLAFGPDGSLYITVFGGVDKFYAPQDPAKEEGKPKGGLIRLEPGL